MYRSNSIIESYHNILEKKLSKKPSLEKLCKYLIEEENFTMNKLIEAEITGKKGKLSKNFQKPY